MIESFVLINDNYKAVFERYLIVTGSKGMTDSNAEWIICDDMKFYDCRGWCMVEVIEGGEFAEEILIKLSAGKELIYCFSDDNQMDCEFLVVIDFEVIRKKYIYYDTPELNEDVGKLKVEEGFEFIYWNDIDYFVEIAKKTPEKIFDI